MRLGVRAHDFGRLPVEDLAERISQKGFNCIQLALAKAVANMDAGLGKLNPGMAYYIREAFHKRNIQIAVLGCYINPVHPDGEERKKMVARFKEHLRFARDFGCSIVATETGSVNADYSFHPDNRKEEAFQTFMGSLEDMVEEAEKFGVFVCIEGVARHVISTPEKIKRVLDSIKSPNLQVLFDPVNLLDEKNYLRQDSLMQESFHLFGDRIQILHAKDFILDAGQVKSVEAGKGSLNYELLLKLLKAQKPYINILMEDTKMPTIDESANYIKSVYSRI